jgi:type I restriction enzyme S subunit
MAGEWETKRIGDLGRVVTGKTPSTAVAENFGGNFPFITIPDMDGRREISASARTLSEQGAQSLRTCRLPPGAVMMSCIATIGNCGITTRPSFTNQQINSLICGDDADPKFVYYCFTQLGHALEAAGGGGSVYTNVSKSRFEEIELALPPLAEQKAIAAVLGALDDKIELNRRMNATLEAMARALFQSWFVDFDPVRAKIDGRPPASLDPATAALFPDSFQDSELGPIPKSWQVRTIEDVCKTVTRGVTPEYQEGSGRFIINQRVNRGSDLDWSSLKELSPSLYVPPDRYAKRWDVLVNCLGEGTLGRTHLYKGESDVYAIDQHMSVCRAEYPSGGAYIYQVLSSVDGQAKIESLKTGSTGMTMFNISKLRAYDLVWPSEIVLEAYFATVESLWLKVANNESQSRTLATLRDTLLPKLLSGELSVAATDKESLSVQKTSKGR